MPFVTKSTTEAGRLGIWELTETPEELFHIFRFTEQERKEYQAIKYERRKKEFLSVRLLLENMLDSKPEVDYDKFGKPILINHKFHVSISHSAFLVTALISEKNIGIDVEDMNRETSKIADRYLSPEELSYINSTGKAELGRITYWSAKEAIFKCTHLNGIHFNKQIIVSPFDFSVEQSFEGKCIEEDQVQNFRLWNIFYKNNVIVCCIETEQ